MNWLQRLLHTHRGPYVQVSYIRYSKSEDVELRPIGEFTRPICRCTTCGQIFMAAEIPGRWTLEELKRL